MRSNSYSYDIPGIPRAQSSAQRSIGSWLEKGGGTRDHQNSDEQTGPPILKFPEDYTDPGIVEGAGSLMKVILFHHLRIVRLDPSSHAPNPIPLFAIFVAHRT